MALLVKYFHLGCKFEIFHSKMLGENDYIRRNNLYSLTSQRTWAYTKGSLIKNPSC